MMTALPFQAEQPAFARMGELANYANLGQEEQERYMRSLDTWRTVMAADKFSDNKGRAEGESIGREKERIANALKMIAYGIPKETVLAALGLSAEDIES